MHTAIKSNTFAKATNILLNDLDSGRRQAHKRGMNSLRPLGRRLSTLIKGNISADGFVQIGT